MAQPSRLRAEYRLAGKVYGRPLVRMLAQHERMKEKWPDWEPAHGMPYEDVENIRPETMAELWLKTYGDARDVIMGVESAGNRLS